MSKYNDFICEIIANHGQHRKSQSNPEGMVYETHHIKPRCMGGTEDIYNLVDLTPREHYIAHMLLAEEYPNEEKIVCAWHFMSVIKQDRYQATPEEYEKSRIAIVKNQGDAVYQLDENGNILGCYHSIREAGRQLNISYTHIVACCNKERQRASGFYWQKVEDYNKNGFNHKPFESKIKYNRPVNQYSLDGEYIATFNSLSEAGRAVKRDRKAISACCEGKTSMSAGYKWKFVEE